MNLNTSAAKMAYDSWCSISVRRRQTTLLPRQQSVLWLLLLKDELANPLNQNAPMGLTVTVGATTVPRLGNNIKQVIK